MQKELLKKLKPESGVSESKEIKLAHQSESPMHLPDQSEPIILKISTRTQVVTKQSGKIQAKTSMVYENYHFFSATDFPCILVTSQHAAQISEIQTVEPSDDACIEQHVSDGDGEKCPKK